MSFHLVVTRELAPYKIGALIVDPGTIEAVLAGPGHRSVVKVLEQLTHAGVEKAAKQAAAAQQQADVAHAEDAPHAGTPTL